MNARKLCIGFAALCLLNACTPSREKLQEQIATLETSVIDAGDTTQQEKLFKCYDRFAKKFPEDSLTAEYLFRKAGILRVEKKGDPALDALAEIVNRYPESPRVVECYFLRGLIYEEVFYDQQLAKKAYLNFIDRYPNHPLAENAAYAIHYLGMSPEDIIASFEAPADSTEQPEE